MIAQFLENLLQSLAAGLLIGAIYGLMCVGLALIFGNLPSPVLGPPPRALPPLAAVPHESNVDAEVPATLMAYRRAARQSPAAFEALLAHQGALSPGSDYAVNAFTRDLPDLTD